LSLDGARVDWLPPELARVLGRLDGVAERLEEPSPGRPRVLTIRDSDTRLTPADRVAGGRQVSGEMKKPLVLQGFSTSEGFTKAVLYR
jgi:hypothetical protein